MGTGINGVFIELFNQHIVRYNAKFGQAIGKQNLCGKKLADLIELDDLEVFKKFQQSNILQTNFIFLSNLPPNKLFKKGGIGIFYCYLEKDDSQKIAIFTTNYLTWLHQIIQSWNSLYEVFTRLNQEYTQTIFDVSSPLSAFKALQPMFTMQKTYSTKLYANTMLDTARLFFNNRFPSRTSDYLANVVGSLTSEINKYCTKKYQELDKFLAEDTQFTIMYENDIYIPNIHLHKNLIFSIAGDSYLNELLKQNISLT